MKHLLLMLLALPSLAFGQEVKKHVRFIPLGELPEWEEDVVDGIRVARELPPGAMPPTTISASAGEDKVTKVDLNLRQPSPFMTFGPRVATLGISEGEIPGQKTWLKGPRPTKTLSLGVLFRDPANMTWLAPKMLMLSDDPGDFPLGQVRFVNVSDLKAIVKVGKKAEVIAPGETLLKTLKPGANPIVAGYYDKNNAVVMIFQNDLRLVEGQRIQAFFYKGQGDKPRTDVKFLSFPEPIPKP